VRRNLGKVVFNVLALASGLAILAPPFFATADVGDEVLQGGAWHFKSVPCVNTVVLSVEPRLEVPGQKVFTAQEFQQYGVSVEFNTGLGIANVFPGRHAGVVTYGGSSPQNATMMAERKGDRVQVCLLSTPTPSYAPDGTLECNPDKDPRGWMYRVYDYRLHAAYSGQNSEHGCGGA